MLGDYPSFQYNPPDEPFWIDVVSRLGEAFSYAELQTTIVEIEGMRIPVVNARTLYKMKKDTVRYKDKIDAARLRERFDLEE